jgi:precorrin-3B synthase
MSRPVTRGACPRLSAPMPTGDGLLARLVPAGPMPLDAFAALCAAARDHGNGVIEVSARGSLQVRGLTPVSAPLFAPAVDALDIDICEGVPVLADPIEDPSTLIDSRAVAGGLRRAIAAAELSLAPKVSVIVDGGGRLHLDALTADVRLRAIPAAGGAKLLVSLAGDATSATPLGLVGPDDALGLVLCLLSVIAGRGFEARASDVLRSEGVNAFRAAAGNRIEAAVPVAPRPLAETIGLHWLKSEACAIGVALAFGHAKADDLVALAGIARANGATWAASAPNRTLLFGPIDEMTGFVLAIAADHLGFVVDARDQRRRVVACPGAPACASGHIAARALSAEIASALPSSQADLTIHVSGCAKGCAHPSAAPLTIVGTEHGCGIIRNGSPQATPERFVEARDLVTEIHEFGVKARETVDA